MSDRITWTTVEQPEPVEREHMLKVSTPTPGDLGAGHTIWNSRDATPADLLAAGYITKADAWSEASRASYEREVTAMRAELEAAEERAAELTRERDRAGMLREQYRKAGSEECASLRQKLDAALAEAARMRKVVEAAKELTASWKARPDYVYPSPIGCKLWDAVQDLSSPSPPPAQWRPAAGEPARIRGAIGDYEQGTIGAVSGQRAKFVGGSTWWAFDQLGPVDVEPAPPPAEAPAPKPG